MTDIKVAVAAKAAPTKFEVCFIDEVIYVQRVVVETASKEQLDEILANDPESLLPDDDAWNKAGHEVYPNGYVQVSDDEQVDISLVEAEPD